MIILYSFGPAFGLPDPSPFCMKADILLQMSGKPFERRIGDLRRAPKGKLPMIVDDGQPVADSSFIRFHLERKYGIDFDEGLSARERGIAWAAEKMAEEQLYWAVVAERWTDAANFDRGPRQFFAKVPAPLRPLVVAMVKRGVRKALHGQGMGRHSEAERRVLVERGLDALVALVGDRPYLGGDAPCGADASLGAFAIAGRCTVFSSPFSEALEQRPSLVAYADRIRSRFFGPADAVRTAA